jgi:hypothetical protein
MARDLLARKRFKPMLRMKEKIWRALRKRNRLASSPKVTSRHQCKPMPTPGLILIIERGRIQENIASAGIRVIAKVYPVQNVNAYDRRLKIGYGVSTALLRFIFPAISVGADSVT